MYVFLHPLSLIPRCPPPCDPATELSQDVVPQPELPPSSTLRDTLIIFVSYYLWFWVTAAQHILGQRATQHVFKEDT